MCVRGAKTVALLGVSEVFRLRQQLTVDESTGGRPSADYGLSEVAQPLADWAMELIILS
jgi:hypothetical protein